MNDDQLISDIRLINRLKANLSGTCQLSLEAALRLQEFVSMDGKISGIIFGVSCDGGKTAVAWKWNVFEALEYLELQNKNGENKYSVVAVKLEDKGILE